MDILISNLLSESILDFGKWLNRKYTNTRFCVFSVWSLPEVQNWFQKQIWKKLKNGYSIVFSKSDLSGIGYIFWQFFFLKKPNTPIYA